MAKLLVGILIGIIVSADAFMVGFCVWYERHHPQTQNWCFLMGDEVKHENTNCL